MASLYLHIPFCEKKCIYCDFYSIESVSFMEQFLAALHGEIDRYAEYGKSGTFDTIFFGGGTPSLLSVRQLESILTHLRSVYPVSEGAEITLEANPGTVTREKLEGYRSLGVNRLSIGIQSFDEVELKFLSRIHDALQAVECVELARISGFANVSLDLIFSLPGQSLKRWKGSLEKALSLGPEHISAYSLIVEDHTLLARMVNSRQVSPNPVEDEAELYELTMSLMGESGYEHYEVSNFARPGFRSRHNYNYWTHGNYLGFGPSAHSFWRNSEAGGGERWWNISNLSHYQTLLQEDHLPLATRERLSREEMMTERMFLGLRSDGLDLARLRHEFDVDLSKSQIAFIDSLLYEEKAIMENERLRLTPRGYLLCDEICARVML